MDADSRQKVAKMMGLLKVKNGIIDYANTSALQLLNSSEKIIGEKISSIMGDYLFPGEYDNPYYTIMKINSQEMLVASTRLPSPPHYFLIMFCIADQLAPSGASMEPDKQSFSVSFLDSLLDDILIVDGKGVVIHACPTFEEFWGVKPEELVGKTIYELEKQKVYYPSASAVVLETKRKVTIVQQNRRGEKYLVTAVPVFDQKNKIKKIVSYTQDIKDFAELQKQYRKLKNQVKRYSLELSELRQKEMQFPGIIAKSRSMKNILKLVQKVAKTNINLIITGETGVGKNLVAKMLHHQSDRKDGPFIEINCGAIPEALLESELFGYEVGAFTGAHKKGKIGVIEMAQKGTLFLDEIGDLPIGLQVKLLKVIQEKTILKVGGVQPIEVDFRLVSATNQDLKAMVGNGSFRADLYYRLNVIPIKIPPLRERQEDILALIYHFLAISNAEYKKSTTFSKTVINTLLYFDWPGNVRELKNLIERIVITADKKIINKKIYKEKGPPFFVLLENETLAQAKDRVEKQIVRLAYSRFKTSVGVGKFLGISQTSASRKIRKHISR